MRYLPLFAILLLSVACTEKRSFSPAPEEHDLLVYDIPLNVDTQNMSEELKVIAEAIQQKNRVSFRAISKEILNRHSSNLNEDQKNEMHDKFNNITMQIPQRTDVFSIKSTVESAIESSLKQEIKYNVDAIRLTDILDKAKLQCSSGSEMIVNAMRASRSGLEFRRENLVFIVQSGHVLPGKMINVAGEWRLYGIESTSLGDGIISMGSAASLSSDSRIIDADLYHLTQIFRPYFKNPEAEVEAGLYAIQFTAEKYGIDEAKHTLVDFTKIHSQQTVSLSAVQETLKEDNSQTVDAIINFLIERYTDSVVKKEKYTEFFKPYSIVSLLEFKKNLEAVSAEVTLNLAKGFVPTPSQLLKDILGLDLGVLKKVSGKSVLSASASAKVKSVAFNSSIFSFGSAKVSTGDQPRQSFGMDIKFLQSEIQSYRSVHEEKSKYLSITPESPFAGGERGVRAATARNDKLSSWLLVCNNGNMLSVEIRGGGYFEVESAFWDSSRESLGSHLEEKLKPQNDLILFYSTLAGSAGQSVNHEQIEHIEEMCHQL